MHNLYAFTFSCNAPDFPFQIMEINGQNFENISYAKAVDILRNNTHLSLTVKTNIFGEEKMSRQTMEAASSSCVVHRTMSKQL